MSDRAATGGRRRRILTLPVAMISAITAAFGISPAAHAADADRGPERPPGLPGDARRDAAGAPAPHAGEFVGGDYVVAPGDTIAAIAARYGLRTADLLARNGLSWSSSVYPGQRLALGERSASPSPHPVAGDIRRHAVADGDTIASIAEQYGIGHRALLAANGLGPTSVVFPGESVVLPGIGDAAAE